MKLQAWFERRYVRWLVSEKHNTKIDSMTALKGDAINAKSHPSSWLATGHVSLRDSKKKKKGALEDVCGRNYSNSPPSPNTFQGYFQQELS